MTADRTLKNRPHLKSRNGPSAAPRPRRLARPVRNPEVAQAQLFELQFVGLQAIQFQVVPVQVVQPQIPQPQVAQLQVTQLPVAPPEVVAQPTPHPGSPSVAVVPRLGDKRSSTDASLRSMALEAKRHKNYGMRRAPHAKIMAAHTKAEVQRLQRSIRLIQGHYHIPPRPHARSKEVKAARRFKRKVEEHRRRYRNLEGLEYCGGSFESPQPAHQPMVLDEPQKMIYAIDPITLQIVAAIPQTWGYRAMWQHLASMRRLDLAAHIGCPDSELSKDVDFDMVRFDNEVSVPVEEAMIQSASSDQVTTLVAGAPFQPETMEGGPSNKVPQVKVPAAAVVAKKATPPIPEPAAGSSSAKARLAVVPGAERPARKERALPRRSQREATTTEPTIQEAPAATVPTVGLPSLSPPRAPAAEPMTEEEFQAGLEAFAESSSAAPGLPQAPASQNLPVPTPFLPTVKETASAPPMGIQHPQGLPAVAADSAGTGQALPPSSSAPQVPAQYPEVPGRKVRRLPRSRAMLDSTAPMSAPTPVASTSAGRQPLAPTEGASGSGLTRTTAASTERVDRKGKGKEKAPQVQVDTRQPGTADDGSGVSGHRSVAQIEGPSGSGSSGLSAASGSATSATERADRKGKGKEKVPEYLKNLAAWGLDVDEEEEEEAQSRHTFRATTRTAKGAGGLIRISRSPYRSRDGSEDLVAVANWGIEGYSFTTIGNLDIRRLNRESAVGTHSNRVGLSHLRVTPVTSSSYDGIKRTSFRATVSRPRPFQGFQALNGVLVLPSTALRTRFASLPSDHSQLFGITLRSLSFPPLGRQSCIVGCLKRLQRPVLGFYFSLGALTRS